MRELSARDQRRCERDRAGGGGVVYCTVRPAYTWPRSKSINILILPKFARVSPVFKVFKVLFLLLSAFRQSAFGQSAFRLTDPLFVRPPLRPPAFISLQNQSLLRYIWQTMSWDLLMCASPSNHWGIVLGRRVGGHWRGDKIYIHVIIRLAP